MWKCDGEDATVRITFTNIHNRINSLYGSYCTAISKCQVYEIRKKMVNYTLNFYKNKDCYDYNLKFICIHIKNFLLTLSLCFFSKYNIGCSWSESNFSQRCTAHALAEIKTSTDIDAVSIIDKRHKKHRKSLIKSAELRNAKYLCAYPSINTSLGYKLVRFGKQNYFK